MFAEKIRLLFFEEFNFESLEEVSLWLLIHFWPGKSVERFGSQTGKGKLNSEKLSPSTPRDRPSQIPS